MLVLIEHIQSNESLDGAVCRKTEIMEIDEGVYSRLRAQFAFNVPGSPSTVFFPLNGKWYNLLNVQRIPSIPSIQPSIQPSKENTNTINECPNRIEF